MARIRVSGASGTSENSIIFIPAGGHSHDGVTSSLISTEKYSIYDFSPSFVNSTQSQTRAIRQENNRLAFESLVVNIVNQSVLVPAGIRLNPGTLNASAIIANTITAVHIAANTITADELVSNIILVNNTISSNLYTSGSVGWRISNDGSAEFSNVVVRGNIFSNVGTIGGWTLSSNSLASGTGSTTLYSNGAAVIGNTTIAADGQITNGGSFSVSSTGVLTATGASFSGTITGNTTSTADLFIREPTGGRYYLTYLLGDYVQVKRTQSDYSTTTGSGAFLGYFNASAVADDSTMIVNSTTPVASGTFVQASSSGNLTATGTITAAAFSGNASSATTAATAAAVTVASTAGGYNQLSWVWNPGTTPNQLATYVDVTQILVHGRSNTVKTFVIDHPLKHDRYLIHACAEGPTTDVFYRGVDRLQNGACEIILPEYFEELTELENRTIFITPICDQVLNLNDIPHAEVANLCATEIRDGKFTVFVSGGFLVPSQKFHWRVDAVRKNAYFDSEPLRSSVDVYGDGPYTYARSSENINR